MDILNLNVLTGYPSIDIARIDRELLSALALFDHKIVVLDDDPTGVQTVHGVSVYTSWDKDALMSGFAEPGSLFFILTNSRGMAREETARVHQAIGQTIAEVARETGKAYILVSRSDSTLRGHYPLETETLRAAIEQASDKQFDGEIIVPFFMEGGRYTIENIHYVKEGDRLIPAGQTEFARDKSFGYRSSHLGDYVEEKTQGAYLRDLCTCVSLHDIRSERVDRITDQLMNVYGFNKVIVNAIDLVDVKVFALAFIKAVILGKVFLFRSAAAVPKVLGGISDKPLLSKDQLIPEQSLVRQVNQNGGIVLIGSHVQKTTRQFEALRSCTDPLEHIEFNQHLVKQENGLRGEVDRVVAQAERAIKSGRNVVVYTRRERFDLVTDDQDLQLQISTQISNAVTSIIGKLTIRPNFIIAKGGITASDVGTKALRVKKATVMGQIRPGIPVWMTGCESKFPGMPFIIFPGNVGEEDTLKEIIDLLSQSS